MEAQLLSKGQHIQVILSDPARLDQDWHLWFDGRWKFLSMIVLLDELSGTVIEDTSEDDDTLHLSLFMIGGEPVNQAVLEIPWAKIQEINPYAKARVA